MAKSSSGTANWRARIADVLPWILIVGLAVLGPGIVGDAFKDGSVWHWCRFAIWLFALLGCGWTIYDNHNNPTRIVSTEAAAEDVSAEAVTAAIETTGSRIHAIKALREAHPGLGLKTAADLVDEAHRGAAGLP